MAKVVIVSVVVSEVVAVSVLVSEVVTVSVVVSEAVSVVICRLQLECPSLYPLDALLAPQQK